MKIVHVIDYFHPRLGYQETFLAKAESEDGHDVHVVTSDRYSPILFESDAVKSVLAHRFKSDGTQVEEGIRTHRLKTLLELPHNIVMGGLERKIAELQPDLVIAHGIINITSLRLGCLKLRKRNFRLIYDDHMTFGASRSAWRIVYPVFRHTFARIIYQSADGLVGVSSTSKAFMEKRYGFPDASVQMIPLGADLKRFNFSEDARKELRARWSVNDGDVLYVYAGKVIPEKGPHILINAAIDLMRRYGCVKILIVGNGPAAYIDEMKRNVELNRLQSRFMWMNAVSNNELYKIYSAADVAVWPREASMSMMEAMACNRPIIISDDSEVGERLEYNNGLLYRAGDPDDLSRQMEKLLDQSLREEIGKRGRKLIEDKLSWDIISKRFIEVIQSGSNVR